MTNAAGYSNDELQKVRTRKFAADFLSVSVSTMERWKTVGIGPKMIQVGPRKVGYRLSELLAYQYEGAKK